MLVGRERERDVLRDRLAAAQQGQGGTVLISGEAGIGKSALLTDFAWHARAAGAPVLTGRAASGGGAYRPFVEALMPPLRTGQDTESPELRPFRSALGRLSDPPRSCHRWRCAGKWGGKRSIQVPDVALCGETKVKTPESASGCGLVRRNLRAVSRPGSRARTRRSFTASCGRRR